MKNPIFLLAGAIALSGCLQSEEWSKAEGKVVDVEALDGGRMAYTLQYEVPDSTAVDSAGNPINGSITQHVFVESVDGPAVGDTVLLEYMRDEPVVYRLSRSE
ncbi:hypothetical protein [Roseovarius sp. 2305UL8-3]|uniref:hypothetical protein n=1 Tax=Roseovarius conchicola TaxID=3121636 RepID=UPI0035278F64